MASSPAAPGADTTPSARAFALQEVIACWDQGYEALARGDLEQVDALLTVAEEHMGALGAVTQDSAVEASLRHQAVSARGRLEHAMRAGLDGLREEMARARCGAKLLRGYSDPTRQVGGKLHKTV